MIKFNTFEVQVEIQDNKFEAIIDSDYLQTLKDKTEYNYSTVDVTEETETSNILPKEI